MTSACSRARRDADRQHLTERGEDLVASGDCLGIPSRHDGKLALYRALLTRIYPGRSVRAALIWTDVPNLMELSEDALEREIALLTCL